MTSRYCRLQGHEQVRAAGGNVAGYRRTVFHAWHEADARLSIEDVVGFATAAGASGGTQALRAHFFDAETEHEVARGLGVFGSPTLVFGPGRAVFVKLVRVPVRDRGSRVLDALISLSEQPSVAQVQRLPGGHGQRDAER